MQRVVDNFRNGTRFPEQQVSTSTGLRISCNQEFPVTEDSSVLKNFLWKSAPFIHRVCHNPPIKRKKMAHVGGRPHLSRPHCDVSCVELSMSWALMATSFPDYYGLFGVWNSGMTMVSRMAGLVDGKERRRVPDFSMQRWWYDESLKFGVSIFHNQFEVYIPGSWVLLSQKGIRCSCFGRCEEVRMWWIMP